MLNNIIKYFLQYDFSISGNSSKISYSTQENTTKKIRRLVGNTNDSHLSKIYTQNHFSA